MLTALAESTHLFPGNRAVAAPRLHRALIATFATLALVAVLGAPPAVASEEPPGAATITTVLHPGWNMVGWVGRETTASDLFDEIPSLTGVFAWDSDAEGYRQRARPIVHLLDPLMLTPGQGLWLYLGGEAPFEWTREASEDSVLLELRAGRNFVAWAGRDGTPIEEAVERFGERFVRAWRWDAEASRYRLYQPDAVANSLTELNHGDALLVKLTEDARWWQSGTAPPPVVFLGEFTAERRSEIGQSVDSVRAVFAERWGVEAAPTIYIGDLESITPTFRRIYGSEPSDRYCGYGGDIVFVILSAACSATTSTIAHEYFHALQSELGSGYTGESPNWMVEGTAVYAALVYAGVSDPAVSIRSRLDDHAEREVARLTRHRLPSLDRISRYSDFHALPENLGYSLGLLASDRLAQRSSERSLVGFFEELARFARWQDAFESAFGVVVDDFYKQFAAYRDEAIILLPHLTDDSDEPALVFVGDIAAETEEAVRADFDSVRTFFRDELGAGTADYTIFVGAEPAPLAATYRRAFGAEPRDGFCHASASEGRVWVIDLDCRTAAPRMLDTAHFWNVRRALAPRDTLPRMPSGFSARGPFWLDSPAETYVTYAYQRAAGIEGAEDIRNRLVSSAKPITRSLSSIESSSELGGQRSGARGLGFLALELLAERAGDAALFEYYRLLRDSPRWEKAFEAAFGIALDEFYEAFEAYRAEVAPPLPHQTDGRDEPVLVFVGDFPAETEAAVRAEFDAVQRHFNQRLGAPTADYALYIGANRDALVDTHRLLFGTDASDRLCERSSHPGFAIINLACRDDAPYRLDAHHFVEVRDRLAPRAALPDMPAGFGTRGPRWFEHSVEWYVQHGYRVARGFEDIDASRARETYQAARTTRSLESTSTWAGYNESSSQSRALGFLAVEWLAARAGAVAIFEYYRLLPDAGSWEEAFEAAFGIAVDDFYVAFESHRARVAPPLPHLTDSRDEPVLVFVGDFPAETEASVRAEFAAVQRYFRERLGAGTADHTLYIGADRDGLADTYRLLFGTDMSDRFCARSSHPGFAIINLGCRDEAPYSLDAQHFVEVRERLAPRASLPDMPDGYGTRGPRWLEDSTLWYVLHAYRVARGLEDAATSRARQTHQAVLATRSLESTSTWAGYNENSSQSRALGFLAVEWLAERAGDAAIFEYYRLLPDSGSWEEAFEAAFAIAVDDFYVAFEAHRAEVAPPLPHLTDGRAAPVLVFVGDLPAATRDELRDGLDAVRAFFRDRLGAPPGDYTLYIGADAAALDDVYRRIVGRESTRSSYCTVPRGIVTLVSLQCPPNLAFWHSQSVLRELAVAGLPPTPDGYPSQGPAWLTVGSYSYATDLYRAQAGPDELNRIRSGHVRAAMRTRQPLADLSTNRAFSETPTAARGLGALAVEWLVERAGERALFNYYRRLPDSETWEEAFEAAFGIAVDDFYVAFEAHRARVAPPN